jgi:hypothetical protein
MDARAENDDIFRQPEQRGATRDVERSSRRRSKSLARLHAQLSARLHEFLAPGNLWLLYQRDNPFVVFRNQALFDDALDLSSDGRNAIKIIGTELAHFPRVYALVTGHVVPGCATTEHGVSNSYEAFLRARCVEDLLFEAGVNPARVLSAGIVRCDKRAREVTLDPPLAGPPLVVSICFAVTSEELTDVSHEYGRRPVV